MKKKLNIISFAFAAQLSIFLIVSCDLNDTIRTKPASQDMGELNDSYYGTDKLEIIRDWVTIGEDGYLTLIVRTHSCPDFARRYSDFPKKKSSSVCVISGDNRGPVPLRTSIRIPRPSKCRRTSTNNACHMRDCCPVCF